MAARIAFLSSRFRQAGASASRLVGPTPFQAHLLRSIASRPRVYPSKLPPTLERVIIEDHQNFQELMRKFNLAEDSAEKKTFLTDLIRQVAVHSLAEEKILYPLLEKLPFKTTESAISLHRKEHKHVRDVFIDLLDQNLPTGDPRFDSQVTNAYKFLAAHCAGEEAQECAVLENFFPESARRDLGQAFIDAKRDAQEQVAEGEFKRAVELKKLV